MSAAPLAVVTGASSGIGAEFTRVLLTRGYRVLAVARRADRLAATRIRIARSPTSLCASARSSRMLIPPPRAAA